MSNVSEQYDQDADWLNDMLTKAAVQGNSSMTYKFCMGVRDHVRSGLSLHNARLLALRLVMK
jgi:hypothetical protein